MYGITKVVSQRQENEGSVDIVRLTLAEAYAALRRACPRGDLKMHLSIEADSAEEVDVSRKDPVT